MSVSWFPKQEMSTFALLNGRTIYYPSYILLIFDGKNRSPENIVSLSLELYVSKADTNLDAPAFICIVLPFIF